MYLGGNFLFVRFYIDIVYSFFSLKFSEGLLHVCISNNVLPTLAAFFSEHGF